MMWYSVSLYSSWHSEGTRIYFVMLVVTAAKHLQMELKKFTQDWRMLRLLRIKKNWVLPNGHRRGHKGDSGIIVGSL